VGEERRDRTRGERCLRSQEKTRSQGVKRTEGATIVARNDGITFFLFSRRKRRYSLVVGDIESLLELLRDALVY
jgi:hypothetical protein